MDEAIRLLRAYWTDAQVSAIGPHYPTVAMAMEPKATTGRRLPIWICCNSEVAVPPGRPARGWLAGQPSGGGDDARRAIESIHRHAREAGRDPGTTGLQSMVAPPTRDRRAIRFTWPRRRRRPRRGPTDDGDRLGLADATAIFQARRTVHATTACGTARKSARKRLIRHARRARADASPWPRSRFPRRTAWKADRTPALTEARARTAFGASTPPIAAALLEAGVGQGPPRPAARVW